MKKLAPRTVYYTSAFWQSFASSLIFTVSMIFQVEKAGLTPLQLVLVGTALEVSIFIFEVPTGVVADVYSRRLSVIIGVFLLGAAFFLYAIPSFIPIAIGSIIWGLGYTFTSGAHDAWIADEIGAENIGPVYLRAGQIGQIAGLLGIPVSVLLAKIGLAFPIQAGAVLYLILALYQVLFMGENGFTPVPKGERETWAHMGATFVEGLALIRKRRTLLDFMLIGLFVGLYSEGYDRLWTAHLLENFTFPDLFGMDSVAWFGAINITVSLLGIGANEVVRRRLDLKNMRKSVGALQALYGLMIGALAAFALTGNFPLAVAMLILFNVCRGLTYPIQGTWTNQFIDSKVRATVLSMHGQVDALGQFSGGPFIGWTGNLFGVRTAMTVAAGILLPVIPLYRHTLQRRERAMLESPTE